MEIILCVFLGLWISVAGVLGYFWIKREMPPYIDTKKNKEDKRK